NTSDTDSPPPNSSAPPPCPVSVSNASHPADRGALRRGRTTRHPRHRFAILQSPLIPCPMDNGALIKPGAERLTSWAEVWLADLGQEGVHHAAHGGSVGRASLGGDRRGAYGRASRSVVGHGRLHQRRGR